MAVEYQDIREAFSKEYVHSVLPHCPYDCCIDHLLGRLDPSGQLYNLSRPEQEIMKRYVTDLMAAGLSHQSSPIGVGFFFVQAPCSSA